MMDFYAQEIDRLEQEIDALGVYLIDDMGKDARQPIQNLLSGLHEALTALYKVEIDAHRTDEALSRRQQQNSES